MKKQKDKSAGIDPASVSKNLPDKILLVLGRTPNKVLNYKQISAQLGINDSAGREQVAQVLKEMKQNRQVKEPHSGRFTALPQAQYVTGTLDVISSGDAFLVPENSPKGEEDIFVPSSALKHGLHGDLVKVSVLRGKRSRRAEGQVVEVIKRAKNTFVGQYNVSQKSGFVVPDNRHVNISIFIPQDATMGAKDGDKVVVRIVDWPEKAQVPVGQIERVLGRPGEHNVEIHAILEEYELPYMFDKAVEDFADAMPREVGREEIAARRDMRNSTTFTIDPADAKDFDDALSIDRLENGNWEIGVHIADVTHYMQPGTVLDEEAYERGTSVYLVDRVVPMLPEILSNDLCSLRPNEDKLTFSAVFEMNDDAKIVNEWYGKTVIHSNRRFSYEEAQALIEGVDDPLREQVVRLDKLAKILRQRRMSFGAISFDRAEVKFRLDQNNEPVGVYFKEMKDSNHLIEEFMLLANRKVAERVGKKMKDREGKAPTFVYRVHDDPDQAKLASLSHVARQFGYKIVSKDRKSTSESLNKMLAGAHDTPEENMLTTLAMRSMSKAEYSTDNIGHYGLAFDYYTHFTSPIRRYPDVMVHRLLLNYLEGGKSADHDQYEEACRYSSSRERLAANAERDSIKYMQVKYMQKYLGMTFNGVVSGVTEWGIYVEVGESKCEGLVRIRDIRDDYYVFDAKNFCLRGEHSKNEIRLGDNVSVKIKKTDLERKTIDLEYLGPAEEV